MSSFDLGKIKFHWKGDYDAATTYEKDDVVYADGSSWVYVNDTASAGTAPNATNTSHWNKIAQGSDLGSLTGLAAGSMVYFDGSNFINLGVGSADQVLKVSSGVPSWEDLDTSGRILKQYKNRYAGGRWHTSTGYTDMPGSSYTFTPVSANSHIHYEYRYYAGWHWNSHAIQHVRFYIDGSEQTAARHTMNGYNHAGWFPFQSWDTNHGGNARAYKLMTRAYANNDHEYYFFGATYWDGGGTDITTNWNWLVITEWDIP